MIGRRSRWSRKLDKVYSLEHPLLDQYTPDGYTPAFEQLVRAAQPQFVLLPHTYQVRDFAPKLATRFDRVLVSDVVDLRAEGGSVTLVRQLFQGKLNADVQFKRCCAVLRFDSGGSVSRRQVAAGSPPVEKFAAEHRGIANSDEARSSIP